MSWLEWFSMKILPLTGGECPSRCAKTFPAIINVAGNGHIHVKFSTTMKNLPDEELQVSFHTVKKKLASSLILA
jgi:hypothetical protein